MKVLQDIWILTNSGTVLFNRVFDAQMKTQLFGALMSALNSFAEKLAEGGLSNFELSDKRFVIKKTKDFIFVASSSKKAKEKKVIQELEKVINRFADSYSNEWFERWDCDISAFEGFENEIEDTLEEPLKKFWRGF
ncbi:MAG: hypothetical protein EU542_05880 [Promethearchaeota archaeon]|nr:MAG: hypothetical protein EU542_05880 [Candidatus Lokiarchaeota archaeon]